MPYRHRMEADVGRRPRLLLKWSHDESAATVHWFNKRTPEQCWKRLVWWCAARRQRPVLNVGICEQLRSALLPLMPWEHFPHAYKGRIRSSAVHCHFSTVFTIKHLAGADKLNTMIFTEGVFVTFRTVTHVLEVRKHFEFHLYQPQKPSPAPLLDALHQAVRGTQPPGDISASSHFFSNKQTLCLKAQPNPGVQNWPTCSPSAHFKQQEDPWDTRVSFPQRLAAPDDSHGLCAIHRTVWEWGKRFFFFFLLITGVQTPDCNQASFVVDLHGCLERRLPSCHGLRSCQGAWSCTLQLLQISVALAREEKQHLQLGENGPRPVLIHRKLTVSETIPTEFSLWESKWPFYCYTWIFLHDQESVCVVSLSMLTRQSWQFPHFGI